MMTRAESAGAWFEVRDANAVPTPTRVRPYEVTPARAWATGRSFRTWAEAEHGRVTSAVGALIQTPRRACIRNLRTKESDLATASAHARPSSRR